MSEQQNVELTSLAQNMEKTVIAARAPSTVSVYSRSLNKWKEFADKYNFARYFPAEPGQVAFFLQYMLESTKSHNSVQTALHALKRAHDLAGLDSPTENATVKLIAEGSKRIIGLKKVNRKEPLSTQDLNKLIANADLTNLLVLRNVCMYSLAFSALLRFDDLVRIRRCDLDFQEKYLKITISKSKNDQLREGNEVLIDEDLSPHSAFQLLQSYLSGASISQNCNKCIFRPMSKHKSTHRLINDNRHISYTTFREQLKSDLSPILPNVSQFSTHSLHAGGATAAANAGVSDRIIQRHGRWKSSSSKNMYIKDDISKQLEISKIIQGDQSSTQTSSV